MGPLGAADDRPAADRRPRVRRRDRRGRLERHRLPPRRPGQRRGSRRLRPLPPLPRRPPPAVRQGDRPRRRSRRSVRRIRRPADDEHLAPLAGRRPRDRGDLRSVRERRPYGAGLPDPRRGRPRQRSRPDRPDGDGDRPSCRRPVGGRVGAERLPPGAGHEDGRDGGDRPSRAPAGRRGGGARDGRGLRCRPGDVRERDRPSGGDRRDGTRRRRRHPRHPDRRDLDRCQRDRVQDADPAGDLRSGDVRDLVQDDGHAPVRPGHPSRRSPTGSGSATTRQRSPPPGRATPARSSWTGILGPMASRSVASVLGERATSHR